MTLEYFTKSDDFGKTLAEGQNMTGPLFHKNEKSVEVFLQKMWLKKRRY